MSRRGRSGPAITLVAVAALSLSVALAAPAQARAVGPASVTRIALTTKALYQPEGSVRSYQPPPPGFQPVFTENVSRHGERTLTSATEGNERLALWQIAAADGALTSLGKGLGPQVQQLLAANAAVGFGNLTPDGARYEPSDMGLKIEK